MDRYRTSTLALLACMACLGGPLAYGAACPTRPGPGSVVNNPLDLYSANGVLTVAFTLRSELASYLEECYIYQSSSGAVEAPTLHLNPGDQLDLSLTNRLTYLPPPPPTKRSAMPDMEKMPATAQGAARHDPCQGGTMVATSTNIHFHGLNIPPVCHEDEILNTDIENTDPAFKYQFRVPKNDSPGMYWYHPHLHGETTLQVNGGAAGALIVDGMQNVQPPVAGLPERVFVICQQFTNPNSWIPGPYQLTLNFQPAATPLPLPIIQMQPGATEFWRVANASSQAFLTLAVLFGQSAQPVEIIALDGIPVTSNYSQTSITLPPAGRAEFIVTGPSAG